MTVLQRGSDTTDRFLGKSNYYVFVFFGLACSRRCGTEGQRLPWHPACLPVLLLGAWPLGEGGCEVRCALTQSLNLVMLSALRGWREFNSGAQRLVPCKPGQELRARRWRGGAGDADLQTLDWQVNR